MNSMPISHVRALGVRLGYPAYSLLEEIDMNSVPLPTPYIEALDMNPQTTPRQFTVGRHLLLDQKETGNIVGKAANANTQSPPSPTTPVGGSQTQPPKYENDFRPTDPGHSPGAGNSLQN
ncbi:hypothetical protein F3Y22_tig00110160pilonHSYRG00189 [Hibiscus syriacus]|uniref:Uncharacterized protein n=1 Tax=Hibiscus syriacus TaxID=106335 RepID=A0A6A3BIG1_HIBSY|nr:hypothetical protein F3Y22_tig00110160pilonHSYRG00189 [Hibiscus syriacus]